MKIERYERGQAPKSVPDCYCWIEDCGSGDHWLLLIRGNGLIDLRHNIAKWVKSEFGGELAIDGELMPGLSGDYYASVITDGRPVDSAVVWESGGFYLKQAGTKLFGRQD